MAGNLDIWNAVEATNPDFTKGFARSGGFRGTATNVVYLAKKATHMFGPVGIGWGWTVVEEKIIEGHQIGETSNRVKIHVVRLRVWYKWKGERGELEHFGQTEMVGSNKYGAFTDEEAPKKSLTDALSKCLSMLGFSADVHLGLYDDNKYVNNVRKEMASGQEFADPIDIVVSAPERKDEASVSESGPSVANPLAQQSDNRTADELAADALKQIDGFSEHGQVTLFMTNKAVKAKLKGLGADLEKKVADHAKKRYADLKAKASSSE